MSESKVAKTPEGRFQYPNLLEARLNKLNGKLEFGVVLIFDEDADISDLRRIVSEAAKSKFGDKVPAGFRSPFRKGDEDRIGKEEYAGKIFVNLKSQFKPGVVNHKVEPIVDPTEIYSGCYGKATVTAYSYDKMGNKGVSLSLQNVQKTRDGEPLAGSRMNAESEFEPVSQGQLANEEFLI